MPDLTIPVAAMAGIGAIAAGLTALPYPRVSFGILFLLASFSRATLETPLGTMRPEMPAIAVVAVLLFARGAFRPLLRLPRSTLVMALAFGTYLGVLGLSSGLVAVDRNQSLHLVAWLATSMVGGVVAFLLVRPRPMEAIEPLAIDATVMGAMGIGVAVLFLVVGPGFTYGIQEFGAAQPRVYALGWETNLYASFLGMCAFFAVEVARGPRRAAGLAMLALILVGFSLGLTRGAYLGLAVGAAAYAAVRIFAERRAGDLPRLAAATAALLVVGLVATNVLLPNALERYRRDSSSATVPASGQPTGSQGLGSSPATSAQTASPAGSPGSPTGTSLPTPGVAPSLAPVTDTLAFRLERVPVAVGDLTQSPLIGLGAESFGQRHPERFVGGGQDHIAIMALAVFYESGIIGATALAFGFLVLLWSLWKFARRSSRAGEWRAVGAAAAFTGSVVSVLVAYQSNNALNLAINWIVIGAAAALISQAPTTDTTNDASRSGVAPR